MISQVTLSSQFEEIWASSQNEFYLELELPNPAVSAASKYFAAILELKPFSDELLCILWYIYERIEILWLVEFIRVLVLLLFDISE